MCRAERVYKHNDTVVFRYPIPARPNRAESQGLAIARGAERLHGWLLDQRPDIVHVHSFVTGLGAAEVRAARRAGARVFVTAHSGGLGFTCQRGTMMRWGSDPCDGLCQPAKCAACALTQRGLSRPVARALGMIPPGLGRMARAVPGRLGTAIGMTDLIARNQAAQRAMLAEVERFVLLTDWAHEAVALNGAPRALLALNRLGTSHRDPKPGPDERPTALPLSVGCLGRFEELKGLHDVVRAVASLPRTAPIRAELRGPASGEGERRYLSELRGLAGGDARITFAPTIPHARVGDVLAGYDVLCCPAVALEGGPTVAIEAHAVGTPVIGTRIGGLAELVDDGVSGRLVRPGDWQALATVLGEIIRDPKGTVDAWRRALPVARTMEQVAADYLAMYAT